MADTMLQVCEIAHGRPCQCWRHQRSPRVRVSLAWMAAQWLRATNFRDAASHAEASGRRNWLRRTGTDTPRADELREMFTKADPGFIREVW